MMRVFYAASGPGDIIESHRRWIRNEHNPTEVSVTFSSQVEDFCRDLNAEAYLVSTHARVEVLTEGPFTLEHRPKQAHRGARYHLDEVLYGIKLLFTARRFRANVALIDSGATHYFVLTLFRLFGIRVIPILYNTLWPSAFPPRKPAQRLVQWLDKWFWRRGPSAVVALSPECERQVNQVRGTSRRYPILQVRPLFRPEYFAKIPPPPPHRQRPFRVMFIGRINRIKGVFDILEIARKIEDGQPGLVRWEICGRGKDFDELVERHRQLGLGEVVNIRGWTSLDDLREVYGRSHASIVPTRSTFSEGLAMTAAEAILAGRPLITNPVVPALEVLRPACEAAKTNDPESHLQAVLRLANDGELYDRLAGACRALTTQFYDPHQALASVLKQAVSPALPGR
jgi:glycogen synthase